MKKFLVIPLLAATSSVFAAPDDVLTVTFNFSQAGKAVKLNANDNASSNEVKNIMGGGISYMRLLDNHWGVKVDANYSFGKKNSLNSDKPNGFYDKTSVKQTLSDFSVGAGVVYKPLRTSYIFATLSLDNYKDKIEANVKDQNKSFNESVKFRGATLSLGASEFFKPGNNHGLTYAVDFKFGGPKQDKIGGTKLGDQSLKDLGLESSKKGLGVLGFRVGYAYRF